MAEVPEKKIGVMDRRQAIKLMLAVAATIPACSADPHLTSLPSRLQGYGSDPDLLSKVIPWSRTLTSEQLRTAGALADIIIPADERSPAASEVGIPDFIDEWVSAPYPRQLADREHVLYGLRWLDREARRRFNRRFDELEVNQASQICDDICYVPTARPENQQAAMFFSIFRNLTAGGFYTTQEGMADIQYVGNVALTAFHGPPREVLVHLGLA